MLQNILMTLTIISNRGFLLREISRKEWKRNGGLLKMEALTREKDQYSIGKASFVFLVEIEILDSIDYCSLTGLCIPCLAQVALFGSLHGDHWKLKITILPRKQRMKEYLSMPLLSMMDKSHLCTSLVGSYNITSLGGRYIISEDGQVQQCGPLTISCAGPSCVVYGGEVVGPLVAAGDVQVVIATFAYDASENEVKN